MFKYSVSSFMVSSLPWFTFLTLHVALYVLCYIGHSFHLYTLGTICVFTFNVSDSLVTVWFISDLCSSLVADSALWPGHLMFQNYILLQFSSSPLHWDSNILWAYVVPLPTECLWKRRGFVSSIGNQGRKKLWWPRYLSPLKYSAEEDRGQASQERFQG